MFVRRPSYHWSALWRITLNGRIMAQRALPGEVREAVWMGCDGAPQGGPTLRGVDLRHVYQRLMVVARIPLPHGIPASAGLLAADSIGGSRGRVAWSFLRCAAAQAACGCRVDAEGLAEAARLSYRSISDLERGINHTPRRETARLLADALHLAGAQRKAFEAAARGGVRLGRLVPRQLPAAATGQAAELQALTDLLQEAAEGGTVVIWRSAERRGSARPPWRCTGRTR